MLLEEASLDRKASELTGVHVMGVVPELSAKAPVCLEHADGLTLIIRLQRDAPALAAPVGELRLTWRRKECAAPPCLHLGTRGGSLASLCRARDALLLGQGWARECGAPLSPLGTREAPLDPFTARGMQRF